MARTAVKPTMARTIVESLTLGTSVDTETVGRLTRELTRLSIKSLAVLTGRLAVPTTVEATTSTQ